MSSTDPEDIGGVGVADEIPLLVLIIDPNIDLLVSSVFKYCTTHETRGSRIKSTYTRTPDEKPLNTQKREGVAHRHARPGRAQTLSLFAHPSAKTREPQEQKQTHAHTNSVVPFGRQIHSHQRFAQVPAVI